MRIWPPFEGLEFASVWRTHFSGYVADCYSMKALSYPSFMKREGEREKNQQIELCKELLAQKIEQENEAAGLGINQANNKPDLSGG